MSLIHVFATNVKAIRLQKIFHKKDSLNSPASIVLTSAQSKENEETSL